MLLDDGDCECGHECWDHDVIDTWRGDPGDYASEGWEEFGKCMECPCPKYRPKSAREDTAQEA